MRLFCILMLLSFSVGGQVEVLQGFDHKSYTPRTKAISDLVFDVENEKIKDQLNEQKVLGQIKKLTFRFFWTAQPERLAVEVIGLPEGFKEIKEELKARALPLFETVIPIPLVKKFASFNLSRKSKNIVDAKNKENSQVDSFSLHFDDSSLLTQIVSHRAVGEMVTKYVYDKTAFSDGKFVLKAEETQLEEVGNKLSVRKEITYQVFSGAGFPQGVTITTRQSGASGSMEQVENYKFSNYLINKGEALKFFLSEK